MFKSINIGKVILYLTIVMIASFAVAGVLFFYSGGINIFESPQAAIQGKYTKNIDEEQTIELSGLKNLSLNSISTNINIIPTDETSIRAHFYGVVSSSSDSSYPALETERAGDSGSVRIKWPGMTIGYMNTNLKLDIYLPRSYANSLDINTTSAKVLFEELNLTDFKCSSVSGDISGNGLSSGNAAVKTISGNINLSITSTGNVDMHSVSGDLTSVGIIANDLIISTTSGRSRLDSVKCSSFVYSSVSGDLTVDAVKAVESKVVTSSGAMALKGESKEKVFVKSTSGNITWEDMETRETKIETLSGRISLDGAVGDLTCNSTSGNISAGYASFDNNIDITSISGKAVLTLPESSQFGLDFKSSSGEIRLDGFKLTLNGSVDEHHISGNVSDGNKKIIIKTTSGDATISR